MRLRRRPVLVGLLVLALMLVIGAVSVAVPQVRVASELRAAAELARQLPAQLAAGDSDAAAATLSELQQRTRAARERGSGLVGRSGRHVPGVGGNAAALATVAAALDDLAHSGLPALVSVSGEVDPAALVPRHGRIEVAALRRAAPALAVARDATQQARDRVAAIPREGLLPQLRAALAELDEQLARAARDTATVARTAVLAPPLLGGDGPRTYLVLFQNPAEVRATGGMPGAFAVVRVEDGRLELVRHGSAAADLGAFEEPVLPLDPAVEALYTQRPGIFPANVNLTPHFPTAAELIREMYRLRFDETVDGVLATDPVALAYLLGATGPLTPPAGPALTADNAVAELLSESYERYDTKEEQDRYFATVAGAVFQLATAGGADGRATVAALARAAGERRILLWSADPDEQRLIEETVLAGVLPAEDGLRPTVGVFLNDGTAAKLSYYLTHQAGVRVVECRPDGRRVLLLRLELGSTAPDHGLSPRVLGPSSSDDPYTAYTNVSVYSPTGGALVTTRLDGEPAPPGAGFERGRAVGIVRIALRPGQTRTLEAELLTDELPPGEAVSVRLRVTPTATPWILHPTNSIKCPIEDQTSV